MASCSRFLIALVVVISVSGTATACTCIGTRTPTEEAAWSDAVFTGMVVNIGPAVHDYHVEVELLVSSSWKGVHTVHTKVTTGEDSAGCGYEFQVGQQYLVYAYGDLDDLFTDICRRTTHLSFATEDLAELGAQGVVPGETAAWGALKANFR